MCKFGDIIVVEEYIGDDGTKLKQHSFVVIRDEPGKIRGLNYDLVASVMSSFKSEEHRQKKLKYEENLEITSEDITGKYKNGKSGYIKADQLFYFDKSMVNYYVLARIDEDLMDELVQLVIELDNKDKLKINTQNLINV